MDTTAPHEGEQRIHPYLLHSHHADPEIPEGRESEEPAPEASPRLSTIREMAREFGVSLRTLRFYEDRGLLRPQREGTVRKYDAREKLPLKMILKGKQLGFTLSEIQDILASKGKELGDTELEMGLLPEQIVAQISYLERQRAEIDEAISAPREAHRRLLESPD